VRTERINAVIHNLQLAQLKQDNPMVAEQELQWRLDLLPKQTPEGLAQVQESVGFALREELRRAELHAEREGRPLVDRSIFDIIAHLMIYGKGKSS